MKKPLGLSSRVCLMVSLLVTYAAAQDPPRALTLNSAIERELAAGQTNSYTLNLDADQIAKVIVEQRGIDIVVRVIAPDGKTLFEVDSPNGAQGQETATVYAAGERRVPDRDSSPFGPASSRQVSNSTRQIPDRTGLPDRKAG